MTPKINTSTRGEKKPKDWKHFLSIDDARQEVLISEVNSEIGDSLDNGYITTVSWHIIVQFIRNIGKSIF
jgi:hypothetical protein